MDNEISVRHGRHTFPSTSAKVNVLAVDISSGRTRGLSTTLPPSTNDRGFYPNSHMPAALDGDRKYGTWSSYSYVAIPGTILRVDVSVTRNKSPVADASVFFMLDDSSPLTTLTANLLYAPPEATFSSIQALSAKGYVLSLVDLARIGVPLQENFIRNRMNLDEVEELVSVEILGNPNAAKSEISTIGEGKDKKIILIPQKSRRRVRVRKQ